MLATLRQRNFGLLWTAGLISITGDWVMNVGLWVYVYQLTQSTLATGGMVIAEIIPRLLFGSIAGVFVDRWDRRRTMIVANVLLGLGLLPLLLIRRPEDVWIAFLVAFFESTIIQFFYPAENALLPTLVDEEYLVSANALNALNNNLGRLIGPALGGFAAGLFSLTGVVFLDAVSFLVAALLIALIRLPAKAEPTADKPAPPTGRLFTGVWTEWMEGMRIIRGEPRIFLLFLIAALPMIGEGFIGVLIVVWISKALGGGDLEFGYIMSAQAIGGILGSMFVARVAKRIPLYKLMGISAILFGLIDLVIFNYPTFIAGVLPGVILMAIVGIPGVGYGTSQNTLMQNAVADEFRGRVFGAFGTTAAVLGLVGTIVAGYLGEHIYVVTLLNVQGLGYVVAGILALVLLKGHYDIRASATVPQGELQAEQT